MLTAEDVRTFLFDSVKDNFLLDEEEFPTSAIDQAIKLTVALFNETPPLTGFDQLNFPFITCLLYGVASHLLYGAAAKQTRNHLSYQAAGLQIDDLNKGPEYTSMANNFKQLFETKMREIKNFINNESGYGNVSSEYYTTRYW